MRAVSGPKDYLVGGHVYDHPVLPHPWFSENHLVLSELGDQQGGDRFHMVLHGKSRIDGMSNVFTSFSIESFHRFRSC